ncbi:MAG: dihydrofolate reductase [Oscillospiraceae bacterium]|nr:dihydrofolate reductase [Oscillospiraceae bacterium]
MNLIVAVDQNWAIGKDGDQLCYLKEDLKRFQELTQGHTVILGRKTLATFPGGRPLKGRDNLVLSRDPGFAVEGGTVFHDIDSLLAAAPGDSFVIGGESVYKALLPYCDTAYVTKIDHAFPADTVFPNLDADPAWEVAQTEPPLEQDGLEYQYVTYRRVK